MNPATKLALTPMMLIAMFSTAAAGSEAEEAAKAGEGCTGALLLGLGCGGLLLLLTVVVFVVVVVRLSRPRPSGGRHHAGGGSGTAPGGNGPSGSPKGSVATNEQVQFVQKRVEAHRDEYLEYAVWLKGSKRDLTTEELREILEGTEPRLAAPVLFLHSDDWLWERGQLERVVELVLRKLEMESPTGFSEPTATASEACRLWADKEARRRLGPDDQGAA